MKKKGEKYLVAAKATVFFVFALWRDKEKERGMEQQEEEEQDSLSLLPFRYFFILENSQEEKTQFSKRNFSTSSDIYLLVCTPSIG